jgi:hypothetical protein
VIQVVRSACAATVLGLAPVTSAFAADGPARIVTVQDTRIGESSGLVVSPTHPDLVWTVNDSGSGPVVYGVSTRTGQTRAVITVAGVRLRDAEAMAATVDARGRSFLWVGDIGDNDQVRTSVVLHLLREPAQVRSQSVRPVSLRLRYPDGPADAETLIWTSDRRLLVVTKAFLVAHVYQVPAAAVTAALAGLPSHEPVLVQRVGNVSQTLVTDGAALPDGRFLLRGYESATLYTASGAAPQPIEQVPLPAQRQGETLAVEPGGRSVLVGSEGVRQPLWRVAVPPAARTSPNPVPTAPVSPNPVPTAPVPSNPVPSNPVPSTPAGAVRTPSASADPVEARQGAMLWWIAGGGAGAVLLAAAVRGARRRGRRSG